MGLADYMPLIIVGGSFATLILVLLLMQRRCPECQSPAPLFRVPADSRQFWRGGWTCLQCGCRADGWGRRVDEPEADPPRP